jgi:hypothetical protein
MEKNRIEQAEANPIAQRFYSVQEVASVYTFKEDITDANGNTICDENGVVKTRMVRKYTPVLSVRLRRTNPTPAERAKGAVEEDLIIVEQTTKNNETKFAVKSPNPFWPANAATEADIKALWPSYTPDMSRDALNALPEVHVDDAYIRIGVYPELEADGTPKLDENGDAVVHVSEKWLNVTVSGSTFELQGDKRQFNR